MRILMICGADKKAEGGVAGVVYNLKTELEKLGHQVAPQFMADILPEPKWPGRFRTAEFAYRVADFVGKVGREFDVVNIHAPFGFVYGARRKRRGPAAGPPYVMTMHGLEERRIYAMSREAKMGKADYFRWKNRVWHRFYHMPTYRWSFKTADQCIVLNREAKVFLEDHYEIPQERVWFVSNGVGEEFFQNHSHSQTTGKKLLFVGTWIDHKGIYYLPEAFEKLLAQIPEAKLTVAGCMAPENEVRRLFSAGTQKSLTVKPHVARQDMPELYAQHDIFVLPSLVEGMPLVLLEAMASGLPVIASESCGMTDLVEDSHNGLLVTPGNSNALRDAMVTFCRDSDLCERLGNAGRDSMTRRTWAHAARRHELVFRRAIESAQSEGEGSIRSSAASS